MAATSALPSPFDVQSLRPLLVHVGGEADAYRAAYAHEVGRLVWRGEQGARTIAELGADPVTGDKALLDFATYEFGKRSGNAFICEEVKGSRLAASFAPGFFAHHREPIELTRWLDDAPGRHEELRARGIEGALVPVVALTQKWLIEPELLSHAAACIAGFPGAVAVVFAGMFNPLGATAQVLGAVDLVRSTGNVVALRGDEGSIGLLANGACAASVGTSSTTRHMFYGRPPKEPPRKPGHEVFHRPTMSWVKHYHLDVFAVPTEDLLCGCAACDGRSILRFADPALIAEVVAHSILCLQGIAEDVMSAREPALRWAAVCAGAADAAERLNRHVPRFDLGRSARAWRTALQPTR